MVSGRDKHRTPQRAHRAAEGPLGLALGVNAVENIPAEQKSIHLQTLCRVRETVEHVPLARAARFGVLRREGLEGRVEVEIRRV